MTKRGAAAPDRAKRTRPRQAASSGWLDRLQLQLKECLGLIAQEGAGCEACQGVASRLRTLLKSAELAERR